MNKGIGKRNIIFSTSFALAIITTGYLFIHTKPQTNLALSAESVVARNDIDITPDPSYITRPAKP